MSFFKSLTIYKKNYGETSFITGLRAFAAIGVVLIHTGGGGFRDLGLIGNHFADLGSAGVFVFFCVSGFSIASSYSTSKTFKSYIIRRLWRIIPLFYFWLAIASIMAKYYFHDTSIDLSTQNLMKHFLFIYFVDYKKSIIGVEWTLPIEITFYFFLPIMIVMSRDKIKPVLLCAISLFICILSTRYYALLPLPPEESSAFIHYSPIPYVFCFALGVLAFRLRTAVLHSAFKSNVSLVFVITLLVLYLLFPLTVIRFFENQIIFISFLTFLLILFSSSRSLLINLLLNNKFIQFCGVVSYGIYLAHCPVISFLQSINFIFFDIPFARFIISFAITLIISAVTYTYIELPLVSYGKSLVNKL